MVHYIKTEKHILGESPIPYSKLTKVKGEPIRHIEQLWDEVKKLKERVKELEREKENK